MCSWVHSGSNLRHEREHFLSSGSDGVFLPTLVSTGEDWTAHCSSLLLLMELQERVELWTWTPIFVAGV